MQVKVRHVIGTTGRLPHDPAREPISGVVSSVFSLAQLQARSGYRVEIWGWNDKQPPQHIAWESIDLWTSPEWTWARFARWDIRWLAPVWGHGLIQPPVDVLHIHVDPNLLYVPGSHIRLLHLHTPVPAPFPSSYQRLLGRADAVICCSEFIRSRFLSAADYPAERTFVVYNGADLSAYHSANGCSQRIQWSVKADDVVVLYAGAIVPEKGVDHLIRAFARVQSSVPNAVLVIVGSARLWALPGGNPTGDAYEAEVRKLARGLNIRFAGSLPRSRMPAALKAADIVAIPSVWEEPLGMVVCEAMAARRPVIASRVGGITETVNHLQTGILVSPGNEMQLVEAIQTLATDESLRHHMGEAAHERAKAFTWGTSVQQVDSIYKNLMAAHGKT